MKYREIEEIWREKAGENKRRERERERGTIIRRKRE